MASKATTTAAPPPTVLTQAELDRRKGYLADNERLLAAFQNKGQLQPGTNLSSKLPDDHSTKGGRTRRRFKKRRLMSRKYCKKTPCRRMGFTQKASCRPYKNCYRK